MIQACVDIGSNTTRLLVAEVTDDGAWRELMTQRAYTMIGKQIGKRGKLVKAHLRFAVELLAKLSRRRLTVRLQIAECQGQQIFSGRFQTVRWNTISGSKRLHPAFVNHRHVSALSQHP